MKKDTKKTKDKKVVKKKTTKKDKKDKNTIDKKYMIPLQGRLSKNIWICPVCDHNIIGNYYKYLIGFAEMDIKKSIITMEVKKCPSCKEVYYTPMSPNTYKIFLSSRIKKDPKETKNKKNIKNYGKDNV